MGISPPKAGSAEFRTKDLSLTPVIAQKSASAIRAQIYDRNYGCRPDDWGIFGSTGSVFMPEARDRLTQHGPSHMIRTSEHSLGAITEPTPGSDVQRNIVHELIK